MKFVLKQLNLRMKTKEITPEQYAEYSGYTLSNITQHLRKGNPLIHVLEVKKYSRFYILKVPYTLNSNSFIPTSKIVQK